MFVKATLNIFAKSRQKILIKRRKVQLKNRPISKSKLAEEREQMNISLEMKKLNIRKEMDKAKNPNHHLNQIIQELFYPQIKLNSSEEVDQRVRQVSSHSFPEQQQWQDLVKQNYLTSQILQNSLPLELLQVHEKKAQEFQVEHYLTLMTRMNFYCYKRESIKQKRMDSWQKMMKKVKSKDPKAREVRCPYLFLERQQIPRHEYWMNFVEVMKVKLDKQRDVLEVNRYIPILLLIQKTFYYIPAQLYQLILNKNINTSLDELRGQNVSNLLTLLKYRNKIKFNPNIKIQTVEQQMPKQNNHLYLARKLTTEIVQKPQLYTAEDLTNIFKIISSRRRKMNIIQQYQYEKIEKIIGPLLSELSFETVTTFFVTYCMLNQNPNMQFIEIVKFDIFRKAEGCQLYFYAFDLITRIKNRKLSFTVYQAKGVESKMLQIEAYDLLMRLTEVMTKMMDKLKTQELTQMVDVCYNNDIRNISILQIISTAIVKKGHDSTLQILAKNLFKLTVLGHSSKMAAKYVFEQFNNQYHDAMKKYKQEGIFLLPTDQPVLSQSMNFNQIHLQQCLLMMLWAITRQLNQKLQKQIYLTSIFNLFPVKIESGDPLAYELSVNINAAMKQYGYFPKIVCPNLLSEEFPVGRLSGLYGKDYTKTEVEKLMEEEGKESGLFVANFNQKAKMFLADRWSGEKTYSLSEYTFFCLTKVNCDPSSKGHCFFDPEVILNENFLNKRTKMLQQLSSQSKQKSEAETKKSTVQKQTKIYDLLL